MSDWWQADPVANAPAERPKITVTPVQKAFLTAMSAGESPDYNTMYGGGRFDELRDHPRQAVPIRSGPNAGQTSSAAGKYQFLAKTWDEAKNALGLPDFSPESQDAAGAWLAERDYAKRTNGRNLWDDLEASKDNPSRMNFIAGALSKTWTSLPGGAEPNRATNGFGQRMVSELSSASRGGDWWANDPVAGQGGDTFGDRFATEQKPNAPLKTALQDRAAAMVRGPEVSTGQQISTDMQNQQIAAGQGVTPDIRQHLPNLISDQVYENDAGMATFKDQNGNFVEAQDNKHVVLRDPADGRLKVFARNDATNENPVVSASRILAPGLAAGAPTARAMIPVATATKAAVPSAQELKTVAKQGFEAFRDSGASIPATQARGLSQSIASELNADGFFDVLAPKTFGLLSKLGAGPEDGTMTAAQMHAFRRAVGKIAGSADETERAAAMAVRNRFDDFLGTIPETQDTLRPALENYAAAKRSEQVGGALEKAKMQAESTGSGANIDNAMRQQFKQVINNPKKTRGWTQEEVDAAKAIVSGDTLTNAARWGGKAAPTGVVSGALSGGAGMVLGGGVGAVGVPVAGYASKALADTLTASKVQKLDELIRSRSPLARQMESSINDWAGKVNDLADVPSAPKVAQVVLATRNLVNNLKDAGISISAADFIKSLQGPMKGRAEDEQK